MRRFPLSTFGPVLRQRGQNTRFLAIALALFASSCRIDLPEYTADDALSDAAAPDSASTFGIGGDLGTLWTGAEIELRLEATGVNERITLDVDGRFEFENRLATGALYSVTIVTEPSSHTCTVTDGTGTVMAEDVVDVQVDCEGPLVAVTLSAPISWTFDPGELSYDLTGSIALQMVRVTVTAPSATAIDVNGSPLTSGLSSSPIALSLGDNPLQLAIAVGALTRSYEVTINRGGELEQYLYGKASNAEANDKFGTSISVSGDTLVIGAAFESSASTGVDGDQENNGAAASGAAYVFRRTGGVWVQEAYLKASNPGANDAFGIAVGIDGDLIVVGAQWEDSDSCGIGGPQDNENRVDSGAAYLFRRIGGTWSQEQYLKASNCDGGDSFGHEVAVSGQTVAISAANEDGSASSVNGTSNESALFAGAAYVFHRTGGTWSQQAYIKATNTNSLDFFGWSIALDGDTLAVGAIGEASNATGVGGNQGDNSASTSGAVYVYKRVLTNWFSEAYVKATNTGGDDWFGASVDVSGNSLVVGATQEDSDALSVGGDQVNNGAPNSGATYVYRRVGSSWSPDGYLKATNTDSSDLFGTSVAVAGELIAVGATEEDSNATGANGNDQDDSVSAGGAVYLYRWNGTAWEHEAYLKSSNTNIGDRFGIHLDLSLDTLIVTSEQEGSSAIGLNGDQANNDANASGAGYVFR